MKSPMLLCFNMSPEKAAKLRLICMRFSIRFQPVPREDWGKTLSALCGLEDAAPEAATPYAFIIVFLTLYYKCLLCLPL